MGPDDIEESDVLRENDINREGDSLRDKELNRWPDPEEREYV